MSYFLCRSWPSFETTCSWEKNKHTLKFYFAVKMIKLPIKHQSYRKSTKIINRCKNQPIRIKAYYVFHGRVTLFFADNSLTQCRITMKFLHKFFLDPEVIFSSHTMFINTPTKEFTPRHLVTFSISCSRIRMKFYFVYSLIRLWTKCL